MVLSSPLITSSVHGTFSAPGICPQRRPGRGSATWPLKRPAGRASTICADPSWLTSSTSVSRLTASGSTRPSKSPSGSSGRPCSRGSPSRRQPSSPPATIDTFSTPNVRSIHQARGAEKRLPSSYTTRCLSLLTPSSRMATANASARGIMCGSGLVWSERASISKKTAPGIWPA